jgi:hypothetical protein
VAQVYNTSYSEREDGKDCSLRPAWQKVHETSSQTMAACGGTHPVGDQAWTLDWEIMELSQPLHDRSLHSLTYSHFSQHLVSLPLFSHLHEEYNLLCLHTSSLMQN